MYIKYKMYFFHIYYIMYNVLIIEMLLTEVSTWLEIFKKPQIT